MPSDLVVLSVPRALVDAARGAMGGLWSYDETNIPVAAAVALADAVLSARALEPDAGDEALVDALGQATLALADSNDSIDGEGPKLDATRAARTALLARLAELRDDVASARRALAARDDLVRALELQRDEARAETDAWQRQGGTLAQQLLAAREVLALCETRTFDAPEDEEVAALGERIGFGALMSAASKGWARWLACNKNPLGSQFTCGPCESTVWKLLADIDRTLRETSRSPRAAAPQTAMRADAKAAKHVVDFARLVVRFPGASDSMEKLADAIAEYDEAVAQ